LGAGKTALVKSVGAALGVKEMISSPTFTMLNEYHSGRLPLYHLDLYRAREDASSSLDFLAMELDELLSEKNAGGFFPVAFIEWSSYFEVNGEPYLGGADGRDHLAIEISFSKAYIKEYRQAGEDQQEAVDVASVASIAEGRIFDLKSHGEDSRLLLGALEKVEAGKLINL
jgi:tRNA A37 threonylcarbamoyladenosine biosynthesis protein TsaE